MKRLSSRIPFSTQDPLKSISITGCRVLYPQGINFRKVQHEGPLKITKSFKNIFKVLSEVNTTDFRKSLSWNIKIDIMSILCNFEDIEDHPLLWSISLTSKPTEDSCLASTKRGTWQSLQNLAIKLFPDFSVSSLYTNRFSE